MFSKLKRRGDRTIEIEGYKFSEDQLLNAYYHHNEKREFIDALSEKAKKAFTELFWKKSAEAINAFIETYGKKPQQRGKETIEIEGYEFSEGTLENAYYSHNKKPEFIDALSAEAKKLFRNRGKISCKALTQ